MSNIEEDIKRCEKLTEPQNANWIGITNQLAIAHLIEKVKELRAMCEEYCPKTERLKELEEENQKYIVQLTDEQYRNLVDIIRKESKKEFEQKVKDKIEDLKLSGGSNGKDNVENLARELVIEVLEELLEDK